MKFSFVILTWNRAIFLEKCITALLESIQDFSETEIVIVDNGSTDDTETILSKYVKDKRFNIKRLKRNLGLRSYKKLFNIAKGEYIVIVDDDVLAFPKDIQNIFTSYMTSFPDYGFLAMDVIQNEFTDGAKPSEGFYIEDQRENKIIEEGPAGGWCSCFRKKDYRKIRFYFIFSKLTMKNGEDGLLTALLYKKLGLRHGVIKGQFCFHANGPHYSKEYGYLERDIEKYKMSGLDNCARFYKEYQLNDTSKK